MKDGGWIVDGALKSDYRYAKYCILYNEEGYTTFWGCTSGSKVAYVVATFQGSGRGTLDFGNCHPVENPSATIVYLNDIRIGAADPNNKSVVISFDYKRDDVLKITEQGTAIIKINSLKLEACGEEGKNSLVILQLE